MKPEHHRAILRIARGAADQVKDGFNVAASAGTAYLSAHLFDYLGFGVGPIIAISIIGFCVGWVASVAAYRWLQIKLAPPPLQPSELFNEAGSS